MRKALALGTAATALLLTSAGAASAQVDTPVSATVAPLVGGGRTMLVTTPPALATPTSTGITGAMQVDVTETNAAGVNNWRVTAKMKDDALVLTGAGDAVVDSISGDNLSAGAGVLTPGVALLTGQSVSSTTGSLGKAGTGVTLLQVGGESPASTYTNTFKAVTPLALTVPNGKTTGLYTGTLTVTLVQ